jgi:hypothetical protein
MKKQRRQYKITQKKRKEKSKRNKRKGIRKKYTYNSVYLQVFFDFFAALIA